MCEILFFLRNNTHADADKDRYGCYKRGMPVVVFEDGHVWGREESKQQWIAEGRDPAVWPGQGKFGILKIPGVSVARATEFLSEQWVDDAGATYYAPGSILKADGPYPARYRRRAWRLLVDSVPNAVRNAVLNNGEYTTSISQIRNYLKRVRDDAQYTGFD